MNDDRPRPKRKAIPLRVRRVVSDRQGGVCKCGCGTPIWADEKRTKTTRGIQWDHRPALALRDVNEAWTDYVPPQHSAAHIDAICRVEHKRRTHGTGATTAGTDFGFIKKERKRKKAEAGMTRPKQKIRSPGFRKDVSRGFDGKVKPRDPRN